MSILLYLKIFNGCDFCSLINDLSDNFWVPSVSYSKLNDVDYALNPVIIWW